MPLKINGVSPDEKLADKKIKNSFIVKKDTLYYLRSYFDKHTKDFDHINTLIFVKPIAMFKRKDSSYTYYEPLENSKLMIEKLKSITEITNTSFNTGKVTSSWGTSKTYLKLGSVHFYGLNRFGSTDNTSKEDDIKHSIEQFTPDSLEIDKYKKNKKYTNFQYFNKPIKHGYIPYFNENNVLNNTKQR
mgnify:FL=1